MNHHARFIFISGVFLIKVDQIKLPGADLQARPVADVHVDELAAKMRTNPSDHITILPVVPDVRVICIFSVYMPVVSEIIIR